MTADSASFYARHRLLVWIAGIPLLIVILMAGTVSYFLNDGFVQNQINERGSAGLGRKFSLESVKIHWNWSQPRIALTHIKIANAREGKEPDMVDIPELDFTIRIWQLLKGKLDLPEVKLVRPVILLEKYDPTNANWNFPALSEANVATKAAVPQSRSTVPLIGMLTIDAGKLRYTDTPGKMDLTLNVDTAIAGAGLTSAAHDTSHDSFKITGQGQLQGKPFEINAQGGSLDMLRNSSHPYPLNLNLLMGDTRVSVTGTFTDPVKMEGVNAKFDLSGGNLADLFYLTHIPLPPTPPYALSGTISKKGDVWTTGNFQGRVGGSDLEGDIVYDGSGQRSIVKASLTSKILAGPDLGIFVGKPSTEEGGKAAQTKGSDRILPDVPINLSRLRASDMDISYKANKIDAPDYPLDNVDVHIALNDGLLKLDPISFGIAAGDITGSVTLDGREATPKIDIDLMLRRLSLKNFFTNPSLASLSEGRFGGKVQLAGTGHSMAEYLADSSGHVTLLMSGGSISALMANAAGLNVTGVLPLLIAQDKPTHIRCVIGDFKANDGILKSDILDFDTNVTNIYGSATINLKDETIEASVEGHPKDLSLSAKTPILITGHLKSPSIGLDPAEIGEKGAGAVLLSVFLTPLAGVIPFIDPGLGKDADCKDLINEARANSGAASLQK